MDGVGVSPKTEGNAVAQAHAETLKMLMEKYPTRVIGASGHYVGIPEGDPGNSEVGHNALGVGQIISQGPELVKEAVESGKVFEGEVWKSAIKNVLDSGSTLQFIGLCSDASTHGNIEHLFAMMKKEKKEGVQKIRVHMAMDGRDVAPESAERYTKMFYDFVESLGDPDYKIASGGGRMVIWMDRYENDWGMIERGWNAAVHAEAPYQFENATDAVLSIREKEKTENDQYLAPFVIVENGQPVGKIESGDSVIWYNFRADRAIEGTKAFLLDDFPYFNRGERPEVYFAGMSEYDADNHLPANVLVQPVSITNTLADLLDANHMHQYAISETVKYGHITYYFDGNKKLSGDLHTYVEIQSDEDTSSYVNEPWMKSAEITNNLVTAIKSGKYQFVRVNYPNGDMIGHFGQMEPGIQAVEALDTALKQVLAAVDEVGGVAIITADHGNVEELVYEETGLPKTSHTTSPVPFVIYDNTENAKRYDMKEGDFGLANTAATIAMLLGLPPSEKWEQSMIEEKE
jgi:2,3-bisphosphoglycerate-independent phosphoglycerate mutase